MTAYGRASLDTALGRWTVEISSVNRKTADIQISIPRHLLRLEFHLRKWLSAFVQRGQLTVRANLQKPVNMVLDADLSRLKKAKKTWDELARELGYDPKAAIDFKFLIEQILEVDEEQESLLETTLKEVAMHAVEEWQAMRIKEGTVLKEDLVKHLNAIQENLEKVRGLYPRATEEHRAKLKARIEEVSRDVASNEERIMREVVILAEKWDVSEEITRIHSHLEQLKTIFSETKSGIGRTIDFLIQELHREINTLGAKSSDLEMIRLALDMKGELEKIREQVQNIE
ncbi:MAG: YicC family protein [Simkania sp.]|nr:YicC family protein [Simkania sp.]